MDDPSTLRYKLWSLVSGQQTPAESSNPPRQDPIQYQTKATPAAPPKPKIAQRDDLETASLLYSQGVPLSIALEGICTLPGGLATKCRTEKISSRLVDLIYAASSRSAAVSAAGSAVHLNLDEVGPFKGSLKEQTKKGMQVSVDADAQGLVSAKLAAIVAKHGIEIEAPRAAEGGAPSFQTPQKKCAFIDPTGTMRKGVIIHLSQTDALVRSSICPPAKSLIHFRGRQWLTAEVVSTFETGFVATFTRPISPQELATAIKLSNF
jgi:hypothetical protein